MKDEGRYPYKNTILEILGAYFDSSWSDKYNSWKETIEAIISENSDRDLQEVIDELEALLRIGLDEAELEEAVSGDSGLGVDYYPPGTKMTYRYWLEWLTVLFEKGIKEKNGVWTQEDEERGKRKINPIIKDGIIIYPLHATILKVFGSHFHNFWPELYGTWEATIQVIISKTSVDDLQEVVNELKALLKMGLDEAGLKKVVTKQMSTDIDPSDFGMTYRSWLELVTELLEEGLKEKEIKKE